MAKKTKLKKISKINIKKKEEEPNQAEIEKLKKGLLVNNDFNNYKSKKDEIKKKITTTKKKIKLKEKAKIKKFKHGKRKKKLEKEEKGKENEKNDDLNLPKKNSSKSKIPEKKYTGPTISEMIKNKENLQEIKLIDGTVNTKTKNNKKKELQKKDLIEKKKIIAKKEEMEKKEFLRKIKRRIKMENGKIVYEAIDIGTKLNEENEKDIIPKEIVYESNNENINSLSYLKDKIKPKKWSEEETNQFYKAIKLFGLDFSFLEIVLKPRIREEIKRKYLKEKKKQPKKIENAFLKRKDPELLNNVLALYKKQNNINNSLNLSKQDSLGLGLIKGESSKRTLKSEKEDLIDYNKEYKEILNKIDYENNN